LVIRGLAALPPICIAGEDGLLSYCCFRKECLISPVLSFMLQCISLPLSTVLVVLIFALPIAKLHILGAATHGTAKTVIDDIRFETLLDLSLSDIHSSESVPMCMAEAYKAKSSIASCGAHFFAGTPAGAFTRLETPGHAASTTRQTACHMSTPDRSWNLNSRNASPS